ncbi:MAG: hypothetical protein ABL959_08280 [Pyrinomonadaceae bacterium]
MKRITFSFAAIAFVMLAAYEGYSQKRIEFARGATSSIVTGTLSGYNDRRTFVIKVRRGQTLTTDSVGTNYITVSIKPPRGARYEADLAANCNDEHRVRPTAAGDYVITVTECKKADRWRGRFRLRVGVR